MNDADKMLEEAVLGGMMFHEGAWPAEVLELEPEHFQARANADIWMAMADLIENHKPVDAVTTTARLVLWEMEGQAGRMCDLAGSCPLDANLGHWAGLLVEAGRKRMAAMAVRDAVARVGAEGTADELAASVQDAMRDVTPRGEGGLMRVRDNLRSTLTELEQEHADPEAARIAVTGLADLDRKTRMQAGDLTIIAGRPSMGKSALAGNIAAHCARNITRGATALFSLEMSTSSLIRRMMAAESGIDSALLPAKAAEGRLVETCAELHELNLYIDDRPALSISAVRQALAKLGQVRLVVLDYLQLCEMPAAERQDIRVGTLTKALKAMAKELHCHVIALSQLSRGVDTRKPPIPVLSDLRDSGNIEQDADNVWFLYRAAYYDDKAPGNVAQIRIAKQRNGATGVVNVAWLPEIQAFRGTHR